MHGTEIDWMVKLTDGTLVIPYVNTCHQLRDWLTTRPSSTLRTASPGARSPSQRSSRVPLKGRASGSERPGSTVSTHGIPRGSYVVRDITMELSVSRTQGTPILGMLVHVWDSHTGLYETLQLGGISA